MDKARCFFVAVATLALVLASAAQEMSPLPSGTGENLRGVSAAATVWASGTHGTYLRSLDAGKTWKVAQVPGAEQLDFRDVEAFGKDRAYLLSAGPGDLSRIYKTNDGGGHWNLQFTNRDPKGFLDCMAFWDREHGIVLGDPLDGKFELLTTSDGGGHWSRVSPDGIPPAMDGEGAFAASGTCVAVQGKSHAWFVTGGKAARVFRSADGGRTWKVSDSPIVHGAEGQGIFSVAFRDARHGVIAGGDYKNPQQSGAGLAFTDDGGATWTLSRITPQPYFSAVSFAGSGVLALGTSGAFFATSQTPPWEKSWKINLNAVAVKHGRAWAVGPKGAIVRFDLR
jgi:photosystem II stability/assembly factor-like uncharacterized protein